MLYKKTARITPHKAASVGRNEHPHGTTSKKPMRAKEE
jgi:hypothetical protein